MGNAKFPFYTHLHVHTSQLYFLVCLQRILACLTVQSMEVVGVHAFSVKSYAATLVQLWYGGDLSERIGKNVDFSLVDMLCLK